MIQKFSKKKLRYLYYSLISGVLAVSLDEIVRMIIENGLRILLTGVFSFGSQILNTANSLGVIIIILLFFPLIVATPIIITRSLTKD